MQKSLLSSGYFNGKSGIPPKTAALTFGISLACHAVLIAVLFFLPGYSSPVFNPFASAINVSLVSLPASRPELPAGSRASINSPVFEENKAVKQAPIKEEEPKEILKPAVKAAKIPKKTEEKTSEKLTRTVSLNSKTFPINKVEAIDLIKDAVKDMEKRVGESRPSSVEDAISKIKNQIESTDKTGRNESSYQVKGSGIKGGGIKGSAQGISGGGGSSNLPVGALDIYKAEIFYEIQGNWAYSEEIGGRSSGTAAVLVIKVMPNGEIEEIRFESRSQNRYLDESAYRAVQKSNPLPPLPEGYSMPYYEVGLRFGTSGLKQK